MPRTKCSKKDERTPLEKLQKVQSKLDLAIFCGYHDGLSTDGALGFHVTSTTPIGSSKHRTGVFALALTTNQFRSKGRKLAQLAMVFIDNDQVPPQELRPHFSPDEIDEIRAGNRDNTTPQEKLAKIDDPAELFVFFKYHDGCKSDGRIGFSESSGPPGSVNHKRTHVRRLSHWTETQFRFRGKILAGIAKACVEQDFEPSDSLRPEDPDADLPWSLIDEALAGGC